MANFFRLLISAVVILALVSLFFLRTKDYTAVTLRFDEYVLSVVKNSGIDEKDLLYEKQERHRTDRHLFLKVARHYRVGRAFDAEDFLARIKEKLPQLKFKLAKSAFEKEIISPKPAPGQPAIKETFSVFMSFKGRDLYELKFIKSAVGPVSLAQAREGKIGIVLDDFGYNLNNLGSLFEINLPITISVLPGLPYSEKVAAEARKHNFEVILHLPLEPHDTSLNLEKGTIMVDMSPDEINALLVKAINSVPGLQGVSNHMGSKATENRVLMKELFREFKKRHLYFLDNLVTDKSVGRDVASEVGLRTVSRSVFLDNEPDENYIETQVLHTAELAAKSGWAIGVGHDRASTIKVLAKVMPDLKKSGFEFVYVSELAD